MLWTSAACLVTSCNPMMSPSTKSVSKQTDPISDQVHVSVNNYRNSIGKSSLIRHQGLDHLADQHSRFLLLNSGKFSVHGKKVSHYGFESRVLAARRFHGMDTLGENVAAGHVGKNQPGNGLLKMWQNSPDHHKMLLENWTCTGIGSVTGMDGTVYCTQIFATRKIGHQQNREQFNLH